MSELAEDIKEANQRISFFEKQNIQTSNLEARLKEEEVRRTKVFFITGDSNFEGPTKNANRI